MIGLITGMLIGFILSFVVGKKGRGYEVFAVLFGIPVFTYAVSVALRGDWPENTYIYLGTCVHPLQWAGVEVFVSYLIAVAYFYLRSRKALSIDDYIQLAYALVGVTAGSIVLSATLFPALTIPGFIFYFYLLWPREGAVLRSLRVDKVELLDGAECYTDRNSRMIFKAGRRLFIGGLVLREFPKWKELAGCLLMVSDPKKLETFLILIAGFLPSLTLFIIPKGIPAIAAYGVVIIATQLLLGKISVLRTRKNLPECSNVLKEYSEFVRRKKGKLDIAIG